MKGAILCTAVTSGTLRFGDVDFKVHVLGDGRRVVEVTDIETLLGLPSSGLGDFLAALPGTDRVRFRVLDPKAPLADPWHVGILAEKVAEMLNCPRARDRAAEGGARRERSAGPMSATDKVQSALLATLAAVAGSSARPGEKGLFTLTAGQERREKVQAIHDRTGWAFVRCRELVNTKSDAEIEALVREHEAQKAKTT